MSNAMKAFKKIMDMVEKTIEHAKAEITGEEENIESYKQDIKDAESNIAELTKVKTFAENMSKGI